jgi:hypothetical protein
MVQHLEQAPEAHPVAIFVEGILLHVRQGAAGPGIAHPVQERKIFVVLDVGSDPEGHSSMVRPLDNGTIDHGQVVDAIRG